MSDSTGRTCPPPPALKVGQGQVFILGCCFVFLFFLVLYLFFALGFLAFRILGFSASWLLGFRLLGFLAFLLVCAAFGVFFWLWLFASSAFPVPPNLNHHFFEHYGGGCCPPPPPPQPATFWIVCKDLIAPPFESSLLQASWLGCRLPPNPPLFFRFLAEI